MAVVAIQTALSSKPWKTYTDITVTPSHPDQLEQRQGFVSKESISWLWIQMSQIYGQIFISKFGARDENGVWLSVLRDLTPKALESGIARLKDLAGDGRFSQYPPNSMEFKELCLAFYSDLRLPSAHDAFLEVQSSVRNYDPRHAWSHQVVIFTASRLPVAFLEIDNEAEAKKVFKRVYDEVCHRFKQGHDLPPVLNKPEIFRKRSQPNQLIARKYLDAMKQRLGV